MLENDLLQVSKALVHAEHLLRSEYETVTDDVLADHYENVIGEIEQAIGLIGKEL